MFNIVINCLPQDGYIFECASPYSFFGQFSQPTFHQVQPRTAGRGEMKVEAWMSLEPISHFGFLVGGVIVNNQVKIKDWCRLGVHPAQKAQELLVSVPLRALANNTPVKHAQCSKQCSRAIAFIVMSHPSRHSRTKRHHRARPIQRLNSALLVCAQSQRFVRRIQIQPNHILQLLDEMRVFAQSECLNQMRLQTIPSPYPGNGGLTNAMHGSHAARAPMCRLARSASHRRFHDRMLLPWAEPRLAPRPRRVFEDTLDTLSGKSSPPQTYGMPGQPQFSGNFIIAMTFDRTKHNLGPCHKAMCMTPTRCPRKQLVPVFFVYADSHCLLHDVKIHLEKRLCIVIYD